MIRVKKYSRVEFTAVALQKIVDEFKGIVKNPEKMEFGRLRVQKTGEEWWYDTFD